MFSRTKTFIQVWNYLRASKWWLHEAWDVHSCLFALKLVATEEGMMAQVCGASRLRHRNRSWSQPLESMLVFIPARFWTVPEAALQAVYTVFCHATSKTVKTPFIIWISWKKIYILYLFGTHAYRTKRPVSKRLCMNVCTVTPLVTSKKKTIPHGNWGFGNTCTALCRSEVNTEDVK